MAVEQWRWPIQIQNGMNIEYRNRARKVGFGEGWQQTTPEGINQEYLVIPIEFTGRNIEAHEVRDFLRAHVFDAFIFAPPGEQIGLYQVDIDSIKCSPKSANVSTVTATLTTAYGFASSGVSN